MKTGELRLKKYLGCMRGVAIGDALGAPVEFTSLEEIKGTFGAGASLTFTRIAAWRQAAIPMTRR